MVGQRTYRPKVASGPPPPAQLPPPPGRIRDVPDDATDSPSPATPAVRKTNSGASDGIAVVAGDLGKVFGVAKRRIEKAINDSYESGR